MSRWKMLNAYLALSLAISGCTTLGYYPDNLTVRQIEEDGAGNDKDKDKLVPGYKTVKKWAYDVQDGLDSRATINHYALEYGSIFALAAAGTMAGLAIFSPGSDALKGLPIGATFLSGAAAYYDNHHRYDIYSHASAYVRTIIDVSDERVNMGGVDQIAEARCLKFEVGKVIDMVRAHISESEPDNLVTQLSTVTSTNGKFTQADQAKLAKLVQASRHDLSDLNIPDNLRETYCQETGLPLLSALENPVPLITSTQVTLVNIRRDLVALDAAIAEGTATVGRLRPLLANPPAVTAAVTAARGKIDDLDKAVSDARGTKDRAGNVGTATTTAAGYITILTQSKPTPERQTTINASLNLIDERERIRGLDQEAANAAAKISTAIQDAESAYKAAVTR